MVKVKKGTVFEYNGTYYQVEEVHDKEYPYLNKHPEARCIEHLTLNKHPNMTHYIYWPVNQILDSCKIIDTKTSKRVATDPYIPKTIKVKNTTYKDGWKKTPVFRPGMNSTIRAIHQSTV